MKGNYVSVVGGTSTTCNEGFESPVCVLTVAFVGCLCYNLAMKGGQLLSLSRVKWRLLLEKESVCVEEDMDKKVQEEINGFLMSAGASLFVFSFLMMFFTYRHCSSCSGKSALLPVLVLTVLQRVLLHCMWVKRSNKIIGLYDEEFRPRVQAGILVLTSLIST